MAQRPIFIPTEEGEGEELVRVINVEFEWFPGFSLAQKQRCITALHSAASELGLVKNRHTLLDISSKSSIDLGVSLSAFNLSFKPRGHETPLTVEVAFQGSKVFEQGGPYTDIFSNTSREAKRDERLRSSGALKAFQFMGVTWPLEPKTIFYDWLYLNALKSHSDKMESLKGYNAFTDIEFNPKRSLNCQAYSAALCVALQHRGVFDEALKSKSDFLNFMGRIRTK